MGLKGCEIQLDNPWNTYYAGQTINGKVKLTFDSPKKVRGIVILFLGEANTEWTEIEKTTNSEGKTEDETVILKGHEEYFRTQYYLFGGKNSSETELPAGLHEYPFTCALPAFLPSSFEGEFGHVRYTIKVTLDRPWKFDQDMKMAFTVLTPLDLNSNPRVKEPFKLELEKSFCCFCCRSGPLSVITHIPMTGFVSGQKIPINCECDNASNVAISSMKFMLRKRVTFRTTQPRAAKKETKADVVQANFGEVKEHDSKTFSVELQIPPLPPSNLNCGIILLDYFVQVECDVSGPHQNLSGAIPISIGTIPLYSLQLPIGYDQASQETQHLLNTQDQNGGAMGWNIADINPALSHIPRPQFSETDFKATSITGKEDSANTIVVGNGSFSPRYPTLQIYPTAPSMHEI